MRDFHHTCKFSTLTKNFSEVWPRQILDLGKQFNLEIRLENVLKTSLQDVLKMSWTHFEDVLKTFLQEVLKTFWQDVLRTSWRHLEDVFKTSWGCLDDVLARRLEDLLKSYGPDEYIGLNHEVLKTSSEDVWIRWIYLSWSWRLEDVFWRYKKS